MSVSLCLMCHRALDTRGTMTPFNRLYQIRDCHFSGTDPLYYIGMLLLWFCCFTSLPFHERSPMLEVEIMTQHIRVRCVLLYTVGEDVMMESVGVILLRKGFYETQKNAVKKRKVPSCVPESNVMFLDLQWRWWGITWPSPPLGKHRPLAQEKDNQPV